MLKSTRDCWTSRRGDGGDDEDEDEDQDEISAARPRCVKLYGCRVSSFIRHRLTRMVLPEPHPQWPDRTVFAEVLYTVSAASMHTTYKLLL
jgi:hypothetical protein